MKILCPEYLLWENGEIYSGYAVFVSETGRIIKIRSFDKLSSRLLKQAIYLKGLLMPGMVNAHCHLELSWLRDKISKVNGIEDFFSQMKGIHAQRPDDHIVLKNIEQSIAEMYFSGIEICADISNTGISFLPKEHSKMVFHTFVEVFEKENVSKQEILNTAFRLLEKFKDSERHTASLSLHTLFTSSNSLIGNLMKVISDQNMFHSIHFLESREELLLYSEGRLMKHIHDTQVPKYFSDMPAKIAAELLPSDQRILFVHNTYASEKDIIELHEYFSDPWFCLCPASNVFITGGLPDIYSIMKHSENIVLGTDSLASNKTLNLFHEMQVLLNAFPKLNFGELLKMATINGARFLGLQKMYGSISPGKKPGLIQIRDYDPDLKNVLFEDIRRLF